MGITFFTDTKKTQYGMDELQRLVTFITFAVLIASSEQNDFLLSLMPNQNLFHLTIGSAIKSYNEPFLGVHNTRNITVLVEECRVQIFHNTQNDMTNGNNIRFDLIQGFQYNYNNLESNLILKESLTKAWQKTKGTNIIKLTYNEETNIIKLEVDHTYKQLMKYDMPSNYDCLLKVKIAGEINQLNINLKAQKPKLVEIISTAVKFDNKYISYSGKKWNNISGISETWNISRTIANLRKNDIMEKTKMPELKFYGDPNVKASFIEAEYFTTQLENNSFVYNRNNRNNPIINKNDFLTLSTLFNKHVWKIKYGVSQRESTSLSNQLSQEEIDETAEETDTNEQNEENSFDVLIIRISNILDQNKGFFVWTKNRAYQFVNFKHISRSSFGIIEPRIKQINIELNKSYCPKNLYTALIAIAAELHETVLRTWDVEKAFKHKKTGLFYHRFLKYHYLCDLESPFVMYNCMVRDMYEFRKIQGIWKATYVNLYNGTKNQTDRSTGAMLGRNKESMALVIEFFSIVLGIISGCLMCIFRILWYDQDIKYKKDIKKTEQLFQEINDEHVLFDRKHTYRGITHLLAHGNAWKYTKPLDILCLVSNEISKDVLNKVSDIKGKLPIHLAIKYDAPIATIKELYYLCPDSLKIADEEGRLAIHIAAEFGRNKFFKFFFESCIQMKELCKIADKSKLLPYQAGLYDGKIDKKHVLTMAEYAGVTDS
eukprot:g175.t1